MAGLERHVAELRDVWGGALCVTSAERSLRELRSIEDDLDADPNVLSAGTDVTTGTVGVHVIVDDGVQERLDERYGRGVTAGVRRPAAGRAVRPRRLPDSEVS